jgi:type IV pilus assembly protein PilO
MPALSLSFISDRIQQLTQIQKIILALGGVLILGAALGFVFFLPLWEETQMLQEDIARENIKLADIARTQAQIARFKKEMAALEVQTKQLQTMLPDAKEIPHLLKHVADLGQKQGLEFLLFKPEKENPQEYIAEIPISLHLKGTYHQIGVFFDGVKRLPRIINVKHMEFGAYEGKTGQITARCQLITYRSLPEPPPSEKPKPKEEKKK